MGSTSISAHLYNSSILLGNCIFILLFALQFEFLPSFFIREVSRFYEARKLFEVCEHLYKFKVGLANSIITHLARGAEIAPLEWNLKSSHG